MSQNYYFKNIDDNEYITASGNGNYRDSLGWDNPKFITWVMLNTWKGKKIMCVVEHEMPDGYDFITNSKDVTDECQEAFHKDNAKDVILKLERLKSCDVGDLVRDIDYIIKFVQDGGVGK